MLHLFTLMAVVDPNKPRAGDKIGDSWGDWFSKYDKLHKCDSKHYVEACIDDEPRAKGFLFYWNYTRLANLLEPLYFYTEKGGTRLDYKLFVKMRIHGREVQIGESDVWFGDNTVCISPDEPLYSLNRFENVTRRWLINFSEKDYIDLDMDLSDARVTFLVPQDVPR